MPEAGRAYEAALGAAPDEPAACRARIGHAAVRLVTADPDGAFADLTWAEATATAHGLVAERARVHLLRGNLHFWQGDLEGCLGEHGRSLDLARRAGRPELEAAALGGLGDAEYVRGRMISAHGRLRECVALCRRHGLGRIEVANRAQIAHASLYFRPQREVADEAVAVAEATARVGHRRAELGARLAAVFAFFLLAEFGRCREELVKAEALTEGLGARRFEQTRLLYLGRIAHAEGRRADAVEWFREALDAGRRTGLTFIGPQILGAMAHVLAPTDERLCCLAEAEALIRGGCAGHNQLQFYPDAIEVALEIGDLGNVEHYAARLDDFARDEPLPWASFHSARGRALAAAAGRDGDATVATELRRLGEEGERLGLRIALPAIAAALG
jgi:tetratricopeptide (TPR) repeat protein